MEALGFSPQALFLNYHTVAALSSLCTCVALLTAAVSLCRIRTVGSLFRQQSNVSSLNPDAIFEREASVDPNPSPADQPSVSTPSTSAGNEPVVDHSVGLDGVRRRKFTAYYDGHCHEDGGSDRRVDGGRNVVSTLGGRCGRISLPFVRTGDLGWYRGQDLTVLNGSVVRLWDGR